MAKQTKSKKSTPTKRPAVSKKQIKNSKKASWHEQLVRRVNAFLLRRPHRSFRRTRRRDYVRSLELPGYIAFTRNVAGHLWGHKKVFAGLVLVYAVATVLLVGLASQTDIKDITTALEDPDTGSSDGGVGDIGKAGLLLVSGVSSNFLPALDETQQVFTALLFLMVWLASVWLIRAHMAGGAPRLRDALYNSGAPIISTVIVGFFLLLQMVPAIIGIVLYSTALSTDFFSTGALAMVVGMVAFLLIVLSLYLLTSGFFALIVVTLPGMYPWQAVRTAGDLVVGRRLRILLRLSWAALVIVAAMMIVMIPTILLSAWLQASIQQLAWLPIVPIVLTLMSSLGAVFMSAYVYMLYRKVVDDGAVPA